MSRRLAAPLALLLAATALPPATAAPVPKESAEDMLKRLYGEVADPKGAVACEPFGKDGLKVTVPKDGGREASKFGVVRPLVSREVEGDFVMTVRVVHGFDKEAAAAEGHQQTSVAAGLSVSGDDPSTGVRMMTTCEKGGRGWTAGTNMQSQSKRGGSGSGSGGAAYQGKAVWVRLTRSGSEFTAETSADGEKWQQFTKHTAVGLSDTVRVGPVAFQSTAGEYTAEFDHYSVKPLTDEKKK